MAHRLQRADHRLTHCRPVQAIYYHPASASPGTVRSADGDLAHVDGDRRDELVAVLPGPSRGGDSASLWDRAQIEEGRATLEHALRLGGRGPYVLQGAIAALQTEESIDWAEVAALYAELADRTRSPVVELNRAVAIAQAGSPEAALEVIDRLDLNNYPYFHSTRAELLRRLGRLDEAHLAYRFALELTHSDAERRFLEQRLSDAM